MPEKKVSRSYLKISKFYSKRKNWSKNLKNFFKLDKSKTYLIKNGIGIKFFICFQKNLAHQVSLSHEKFFYSLISGQTFFRIYQLINSQFRFTDKKSQLFINFLKSFRIRKIYSTKVYIEESADEIKTYLDEKLIRSFLKKEPIIGRCWLWLKYSSDSNKNFWFNFINSCFNYMTKMEPIEDKTWVVNDSRIIGVNYNSRDYEFEYLKFINEKNSNFFNDSSKEKIYKFNLNLVNKYYKSFKVENYLKELEWRNRIFQKNKSITNDHFNTKENSFYGPQILLL